MDLGIKGRKALVNGGSAGLGKGSAKALAAEGVLDARVYRQPGWRFGPFRRGNDRAGFVLARGDSRDDALAHGDRGFSPAPGTQAEMN